MLADRASELDDLSEEFHFSRRRNDGLISGIFRVKLAAAPADPKSFYGGFVTHEGDHDFAGIREDLTADDDDIPVQYARAGHAVSLHAQSEKLLARGGLEGNISLQVFDGCAQVSRLHPAQEGNENGRDGFGSW
jgi:hypothetical protein